MSGVEPFESHESRVRSYCRDFPAVFTEASGPYMWDESGRRYTDLLCGAGALNYGHNDPNISQAVQDYLAAKGPVQSLDLHTRAKAEFIEKFARVILAPRGMDHVLQFPGPAGTLAVEAALKLARKVTGRTNVVAFTGAFHGVSLGSLALTTSAVMRGAAGVPLGHVIRLPYDSGAGRDAAEHLERLLLPGSGIDPPAAVVLETVQGEGGLEAASPAWLTAVADETRAAGALLIIDDIQAGCGRTGTFFSFDDIGLDPDMVCLSKSLSGLGLPMAMLLIRRELDIWRPGEHNGTFRGHNLAFVGGSAALDYWTDPGFLAAIRLLSARVRNGLAAIAASWPKNQVTVTGRGLMSGLRFSRPGLAAHVKAELYQAGIVAETCGPDNNVLKLFPPLTMSTAEWQSACDVLAEVAMDVMSTEQMAA
jgi:diaminobutyrate-2-oxoglutarate transaminase